MLELTVNSKQQKSGFIFVIVAAAITLAASALFFILDMFEIGIFTVVFAVLIPALVILGRSFQKKQIKSDKLQTNFTVIYKFTPYGINTEFTYEYAVETAFYKWPLMTRAVERTTHFLIYMNAARFLVIDKNGFTEGTLNDFRRSLSDIAYGKFPITVES
jgi:hypothetical protein